jgi:hypothetical protein
MFARVLQGDAGDQQLEAEEAVPGSSYAPVFIKVGSLEVEDYDEGQDSGILCKNSGNPDFQSSSTYSSKE